MTDEVSDAADSAADAGDAFDQMSELLDKGDDGKSDGVDEVVDSEVDEPTTPKGDEGDGKGDEGDGADEGADDEDEDEDEDEEDEFDLDDEEEREALVDAEKPPILAEVEKKYPKIFKEFKGLRSSLLREHQFSQVYTHPREAAEAAQMNEDYRTFENEILAGNGAKVLKAIKDTNEDGYGKFVRSILPTLQQHDQNTYLEVSLPVVADVLLRAAETGEARGDKNLVNSVKHIASLIWPSLKGGVPKVAKPEQPNPEVDERLKKIEQREREAAQRETSTFIAGVRGISEKQLRRRIEKGLDPQNVLSPYLKKTVVDNTAAEVREMLDNDVRFNQVMTRIFERARRSGFAAEYRTRLVGTYIGRAGNLIGPIRKRHLLEAMGKKPSSGDGKTRVPLRREVGEGTTGGGRKSLRASEIDFASTSDLDIMAGKPRLKAKR